MGLVERVGFESQNIMFQVIPEVYDVDVFKLAVGPVKAWHDNFVNTAM